MIFAWIEERKGGKSEFVWGDFVDLTSQPLKVVNTFETQWFKDMMAWGRKAYGNGWFEKDLLMQKDPQGMFSAGKTAAIVRAMIRPPMSRRSASIFSLGMGPSRSSQSPSVRNSSNTW